MAGLLDDPYYDPMAFDFAMPTGESPVRRQAARDFVRGVGYAPFDLAGAAVDIANLPIQGMDYLLGTNIASDRPFLGSESLIQGYRDIGQATGLFDYPTPTYSTDETMGRIFGGVVLDPTLAINVTKNINAARQARNIRNEAKQLEESGNLIEAKEAAGVASVLETEAAPLTGIIKRLEENGQKPEFTIKDDGTYLTVKPSTSTGDSTPLVKDVRKRMSGSQEAVDETSKLTKDEIEYITNNPDINQAYQIANEISLSVTGKPYEYDALIPDPATGRVSSIAKQAAIGRAFMLAAEGSPEYKSSVFSAYGDRYPQLLDTIGAQSYDDLVEMSYRQMAAETNQQFNRLPVQTTYHGGDLDYTTSLGGTNSLAMLRDVRQNQNLNVFRGGDPHEFLYRVDPETGLNPNEKFRAVHDYYGHGILGNRFDATGEEIAYGSHSQMYSPLARFGMASETRGQNSVVNYSPLNIDLENRLAQLKEQLPFAKTDAEKQAIINEMAEVNMQRDYAPQKAVLLPPEMIDLSYQGGMPDYLRNINRPDAGTTIDNVPVVHYSKTGGLLDIDPSYVGTNMGGVGGIARQEAQDIRSYAMPDRAYYFSPSRPSRNIDPAMEGQYVYQGLLNDVYDPIADPAGLRGMSLLHNKGVLDRNLFIKDLEQSIKDYGYSGYIAPFNNEINAVQGFYPLRVKGLK